MHRCLLALQGRKGKIPSPGSSLLNRRSQRSRVREMMQRGQQTEQQMEEQAMYADLGGSGGASGGRPARLPRSRNQRKGAFTRAKGSQIAERAKSMTDSEWESVPIEEKHAYTQYISKVLRENPTQVSEQQRRRYFETTMMDPRDLNPAKTVRDNYERLKLGLPVHVTDPQRNLGVAQAIYEAGDASMFDPSNVDRLENAMTHVKQVFADYVQKKREGVSTEMERRQLANLTEELNVETQRHLAHMFKYADVRLRELTLQEKKRQLEQIHAAAKVIAKRKLRAKGNKRSDSSSTPVAEMKASEVEKGADDREAHDVVRAAPQRKKTVERIKKMLHNSLGLDVEVAHTMITQMKAQEDFLRFCEVFARMTLGHGFTHTAEDEGLSEYVNHLRKIYSVDAKQLATVDLVQYLSAQDNADPVDWAKRWYEKALLIPLQSTPEYQRLEEIRKREVEALMAMKEDPTITAGHAAAVEAESRAAEMRQQDVVNLVEKMFLSPDDKRVASVHERRLRHLASMQMESQIRRVRKNAKLFEGVENLPEAEECRRLYAKLLEKKHMCLPSSTARTEDAENENTSSASVAEVPSDSSRNQMASANVYLNDGEARELFEKIRAIVDRVIQTRELESEADRKAAKLRRLVAGVTSGGNADVIQELHALQEERKTRVMERLVTLMEKDVQSDVEWIENMNEADRPPLLPIPEPMSYVSAADISAWKDVRAEHDTLEGNPFEKHKRKYQPTLFGQTWRVPDKPLLFWGTGVTAVQQALEHAAEDAERNRHGEPLVPPYPCPENPWGWRLAKDILDD